MTQCRIAKPKTIGVKTTANVLHSARLATSNRSARHRLAAIGRYGLGIENQLSVMDTRTPSQRRRIMQSVGQKNTGPEMVVRRILHGMGYRYRLHANDLPGTPDIVFRSRKLAIFVHGCFWHGHGCNKGRLPKSRLEYWRLKVERNQQRDVKNLVDLDAIGWGALILWQCEVKDGAQLASRLGKFLGHTKIRSTNELKASSLSDGQMGAK